MKSKTVVLLAFAGICGLVAMLGVRKALNKKEPAVETVSVLVAMTDLPVTARLDETNTEFKAVPVDSVPEGAITDRTQYLDRSLQVRTLPGDWITMSKLSEPGVVGTSILIPPGMRVVTVSVNQTTSHSGMLAPGNRVDVMLTYQARNADGSSIQRTRTVLQYIEIFAVDKLVDGGNANMNESNTRNISVLVTPEQGHLLLLAGKKGDIHLALRSNLDTDVVDDLGIDADELNGDTQVAGFGETSRREQLEDLYGTGDEPEEGASGSEPNMDELLEGAAAGTVAEAVTVDVAPPKNVWEMTIYAGGEATKLEVIDESASDEPVSPAAKADAGDKKNSIWRGLIGTFFRGA